MAILQATEISGSLTLSQPLRVPSLSNTSIGNLSAQEKAQLVFSSTDSDLYRHDASNIVRGLGYQGLTGVVGAQGTDGSAGLSGYTGLQGLQGSVGTGGGIGDRDGAKGPGGATGYSGLQGATNNQTGTQGAKGPKGGKGPAGYTGFHGADGGTGGGGAYGARDGAKGSGGATGYTGYHGNTNTATGAQGPKGSKGPKGPAGYTGYQGNTNTQTGAQGPRGGAKGAAGYTGYMGNAGATGAPGWPYQAMDSNSTPTFAGASAGHTAQTSAYMLWTSSHYAVNHTEMYNTNNYGMVGRGNVSTMNLINKNGQVAGTYWADGGNLFMDGSRWSDERAKTEITNYTGSGAEPTSSIVERLSTLKPKNFRFINTPSTEPITVGLIAQDVKLRFPELVNAKNDGTGSAATPEMMGINYTGLRAVLYEAVKELKTELSGITTRITTLETA